MSRQPDISDANPRSFSCRLGKLGVRNSGTGTCQPSLLAGMLFDAEGNWMTPSYAVKQGTRYRYYVSRPLITQDQRESVTALPH